MFANSFNSTWSYRSNSNTLLLSITVSVNLESTTVHTDTVSDIENNLRGNTSSIIPSGYVLTNESFTVSAFQANSKYNIIMLFSSLLVAYMHKQCLSWLINALCTGI